MKIQKTELKDILPQNENVLKYFLVLCSPVNIKTQHFASFGRLKPCFACFDYYFLCSILLSCGIARQVIQAETGVTASA